MEAFLVSLGTVAVAEVGDRTQLLSFCLASQYRRPLPILLGILVASLANHAIAGLAGEWTGALLTPEVMRWLLGLSFLAMAVWAVVPDKDSGGDGVRWGRRGAFLGTLASFFIAEMGDKTQLATAALAAHYQMLLPVVLGTTAGMLTANFPVVLGGHFAGRRFDASRVRLIAAAIFAIEGIVTLAGFRSG